MVNVLLIIALTIAIIFDCIRIIQYIAMRKATQQAVKDSFFGKVDRLHFDWLCDNEGCKDFVDYLRKHWYDEK